MKTSNSPSHASRMNSSSGVIRHDNISGSAVMSASVGSVTGLMVLLPFPAVAAAAAAAVAAAAGAGGGGAAAEADGGAAAAASGAGAGGGGGCNSFLEDEPLPIVRLLRSAVDASTATLCSWAPPSLWSLVPPSPLSTSVRRVCCRNKKSKTGVVVVVRRSHEACRGHREVKTGEGRGSWGTHARLGGGAPQKTTLLRGITHSERWNYIFCFLKRAEATYVNTRETRTRGLCDEEICRCQCTTRQDDADLDNSQIEHNTTATYHTTTVKGRPAHFEGG